MRGIRAICARVGVFDETWRQYRQYAAAARHAARHFSSTPRSPVIGRTALGAALSCYRCAYRLQQRVGFVPDRSGPLHRLSLQRPRRAMEGSGRARKGFARAYGSRRIRAVVAAPSSDRSPTGPITNPCSVRSDCCRQRRRRKIATPRPNFRATRSSADRPPRAAYSDPIAIAIAMATPAAARSTSAAALAAVALPPAKAAA